MGFRRMSVMVLAMLGAIALSVVPASAAPSRYYVLIGGTCDPDAHAYDGIDLHGGDALRVHYPAQGSPACWGNYDASVQQGYEKATSVLRQAYADHPAGEFVVVGYSQGAEVANMVLNDVADGELDVPASQVKGSLYGDPMQPRTGIGAVVPKGLSAFGFTSPGPGRSDFDGVDVERYCIRTDGVCDFVSPLNSVGYLVQHPCYPSKVMPHTLADEIDPGDHWWPVVAPCQATS